MNIVVTSAFRSVGNDRIERYLDQVLCLQRFLGPNHPIRVAAAEGDSVNDTRGPLVAGAVRRNLALSFVECTVGTPHYGSTEQMERLCALSKIVNKMFESIREEDDIVFYVESDLIWNAPEIAPLIIAAHTKVESFDVFAPLVFAGKNFYDVWGFRKNGARFGPFAPFHSELNGNGMTEVDSVGSCLIMRGEVARKVRIQNDYALVGWCESARSYGFRIGVDATKRIYHPA